MTTGRRGHPRHRTEPRTARCLLVDGSRYLLVVHNGKIRERWGLPGGHVEHGEDPLETVVRELEEELYVNVPHAAMTLLGDYRYRGHAHRVYRAELAAGAIERFDRSELTRIGWHDLPAVERFAAHQRLHADYEIDVVRTVAGTFPVDPASSGG